MTNRKKGTYVDIHNPFPETFWETWELWKDFRLGYDKFKYKGVYSEQMAISKLFDVSKGDEAIATEIIKESISRQWTGFYELKNKTNGQRPPQSSGKTIEFDRP